MKLFFTALALIGAASAQQGPPDTLKPAAGSLPTFEVASIKISPPMPKGAGNVLDMMLTQFKVGLIPMDRARVMIRSYSLLNLIAAAYRVRPFQISGPAWMPEQRFDIDAKIPDGVPPDQVNEMLRSLLAERFGLRLHKENRTRTGYALVVGKNGSAPQLAVPIASPADASGDPDAQKQGALQRTKERQAQSMKDQPGLRPGMRSTHFPSITTARLSDLLFGWVDGPVTDMTGLDGQYDITLQTLQPRADPSSSVEDPGFTIFDCLARQGWKLEPRKVQVDTLVIDAVSKAPTEN